MLTRHQNGLQVTVFEQQDGIDARPRDWSIIIHWAMPALTQLLPEANLKNMSQALCHPYIEYDENAESLPCCDGATGDVLIKMHAAGSRRITRQRLRRMLVQGLEGDIRWGKKLTQFKADDGADTVQLTFEDGESFDADYLVGADGPSSKMRELLVGIEASKSVSSNLTICIAACKYRDAAKAQLIFDKHPVACLIFDPKYVGGAGGRFSQRGPQSTSDLQLTL